MTYRTADVQAGSGSQIAWRALLAATTLPLLMMAIDSDFGLDPYALLRVLLKLLFSF